MSSEINLSKKQLFVFFIVVICCVWLISRYETYLKTDEYSIGHQRINHLVTLNGLDPMPYELIGENIRFNKKTGNIERFVYYEKSSSHTLHGHWEDIRYLPSDKE
jgi:hypothetical protein